MEVYEKPVMEVVELEDKGTVIMTEGNSGVPGFPGHMGSGDADAGSC